MVSELVYSKQGQVSSDELVEQYAGLVKRIAYHLVGRLPASVLVEDLIQVGMIGLLDAAQHYDPSQGASFETYATIRIRGAMLDELRRNDWAPKSVHRKARELADAMHRVEMATGSEATDQAVADEMGLSLDEYHQLLQDTCASRFISYEDLSRNDEGPQSGIADKGPRPHEALQDARFKARLAQAIDKLPEREKLVMALYYDKELNLREIGLVLKVTESRVSQLLSQAHGRLRSRLRDWQP